MHCLVNFNHCIWIFNGSQLAKIKKSIHYMPLYKICRVGAVGPTISNNVLKITIFVNMWNLGHFVKIWY